METRNVILAMVLSAIILFGWAYLQPLLFPTPPPQQRQTTAAPAQPTQTPPAAGTQGATGVPGAGATIPAPELVDRDTALKQAPRIPIDAPSLKGSIVLKGGRIDDVALVKYRETVDPKSPNIVLLSPSGARHAYFVEFGWCLAPDCKPDAALPNEDTIWQADGSKLTPDKPLTLTWDNGEGVRFSREFRLDQDFMFTVTQRIENAGEVTLKMHPYGRIRRVGTPATGITSILHEGPIGVFGNIGGDAKYRLYERQYHNLPDEYRKANYPSGSLKDCLADNQFQSVGGWLGITDKYWLVALVPDSKQQLWACYRWQLETTDVYQTDYAGADVDLAPAGKLESASRLFVGAKELNLLNSYGDGRGGDPIPLFDRAVDFTGYLGGWTYALTYIAKPLFYLLDAVYKVVGNFGIAIMILTVLVKTVLFPLANKSYRAMNKMKKLGPQMQELRTRLGDDKARLNQEMMALYKREKVNPAAGCLPLVVQIPVFIALYQVLYVTIEMRQAPFFGWIRDLSVPDPTSVLNLFGLLPWRIPHGAEGFLSGWGLDALPGIGHFVAGFFSIINIGIWPLILGVTMFLQQKMNPPPPDPVQAKIFTFLPIMFTFMMAQFQAGLVIYWSWNNLLSIAQQWLLKRMDERRDKQPPKPPEKTEKQLEKPETAARPVRKSQKRK